ncbi:aminopeptidase P N-terminal domain-containing protein [Siphonobacter sp. SORGH_AS_1065]|uniref:aminopeptidase P N-terminal domain-containing protein n=1 Tax=Siphonobacter sp. SORGH_AS_1065 TaxID=3041795 RepID=UPI002784BC20|nr:aminopeptidase P N-terminal domain-containing protein [Siphonobacter sp. SORGH_AS_1065]MDQ1089292.1 Xaa-Pro aminopeptidase [Siphonobacter sp. SORGH_AS_1065]
MKYHPIPNKLFIRNRHRLSNLLKPKSIAIFHSNDILPTNADGTLRLRQNSDLFYLSGIDQEESIVVLFPDAPDEKHREILFLRETNEHIAVWEGYKYTKEHAREVSGIQTVYWTRQFDTIIRTLIFEAEHIYLNANEHTRADIVVETREARFVQKYQSLYPLHKFERLAPLMHNLRAIKQEEELPLLQEAMRITEDGFRRLLSFVKPGVWEFEIEAELLHEFVRQRSKGFAYEPIIASGANACVLHYLANDQQCKAGEVILLDVAAEYANYNADLTRSIPVSGRYTPRQRQVYDAVHRVMKEATAMLVPGNLWDEYHYEVGKIMESELKGLGLISQHDIDNQDPDWPAYKKYFMHGTSHFLGLDVHDVGSKYRRFEPGMVFTCEPGIYIPEEGLGIRLENNILITEGGNIDMMASIPVDADEIETLMNA